MSNGANVRRRQCAAARLAPGAGLSLAVLFAGGCQLGYFLTARETRPVKAEYAKIGSRTAAVVVWADRHTLDVDPRARRRVCDAITYDLRKHLPAADFVSARKVEDLQERSGLDWESMTSREIAERLDCDVVLRVDLLEYTTRAADTKELRRGRVRGTVSVYEPQAGTADSAVYEAEIVATYPPASQGPLTEADDAELLREATVQFAQAVARKFYDHEVSLRGPDAK